MTTKRQYEDIVTDELAEADWKAIFSLNLSALHRGYLELFKENSDRAMDRLEVIDLLKKRGVIRSNADKLYFHVLSGILRNRGTPYRVRSVSKKVHQHQLYKVVKVGPPQKRERAGSTNYCAEDV